MARWRKIDVRIHGDEKFRSLSRAQPNAQTLWFYLLTSPDTTSIPGLFRAGEAQIAEALGWTVEGFREPFRELFAKGMAKADWSARLVWLPKAIKHDPPPNPNVIKGWRVGWDELPECPLKAEAWRALSEYMDGLPEGFREAFAKGLPEPLPQPYGESGAGAGAGAGAGQATTLSAAADAIGHEVAVPAPELFALPEAPKKAKPPKPKPPPNPRHHPLRLRLVAAFLAVRKTTYAFTGRDAKAVSLLLTFGHDDDEIERRWRIALNNAFGGTGDLMTFANKFNAHTTPGVAGTAGPPAAPTFYDPKQNLYPDMEPS